MVKLIIEISEENSKKLGDVTATQIDVGIAEVEINATKDEIKCCKLIKERAGLNKRVDIMNTCKKESIEELLKKLFM